MRALYRISLFFSVGCIAFFLGVFANQFYTSYIRKDTLRSGESYQNYGLQVPETGVAESAPESAVSASAGKEQLIDCDTNYIVESYDMDTKETVQTEEDLPAKYIGMSREAFEEELSAYTLAPTLRDQEKGFLSASLSSFSPQKIVVRKSYYIAEPEPVLVGYYLAVENNYVIVYEGDMKTVYQTTDIMLDELPKDLQEEIMNMKYLASEEEVYQFLESHSS